MKHGCELVFVHVYNTTQVSSGVLTKLDLLVKELTKVQLRSKLYVVPFEALQREIIMFVPSKLRMIVYRRFMMKIINEIAAGEKAKAVVTGDSLGQVASQTLENIGCIYSSSKLPVLAPLIGINKEEIIKSAERLGSYEHSIIPYPDCCSFMIAKHPETRANPGDIEKAESFMRNKEQLVQECISKAVIKRFRWHNGLGKTTEVGQK